MVILIHKCFLPMMHQRGIWQIWWKEYLGVAHIVGSVQTKLSCKVPGIQTEVVCVYYYIKNKISAESGRIFSMRCWRPPSIYVE